MPIKPNNRNKYLVQITLDKREYDLFRKEAYRVDKTINMVIKDLAMKAVRKE